MAVLLTGNTLEASLKMRCDNSGASYAIYWANVNNQLVVAGDYTTEEAESSYRRKGVTTSFAEQSEGFALDADGGGPVARCLLENKQIFIPNAPNSDMTRRDLAEKFRIGQVCLIPFEGGVLEFGTLKEDGFTQFSKIPEVPIMPKSLMREAYEFFGASYTMFWAIEDGKYVVKADHVTAARKLALKKTRKDDKTFCSESRQYSLDPAGSGPIATAARLGKQIVVEDLSSMQRAELAEEFGVSKIVCTPVEGGVLEYGVPNTMYLESNLLGATLKLRTDTSGAGYAMYWKEVQGKFTVASEYLSPARTLALIKLGRSGDSFCRASRDVVLDANGQGPVATVYRTQKPLFIKDASNEDTLRRKGLAQEYGIASICLQPVEGGVIEYGTSIGPETCDWETIEDANVDIIPRGELRRAFANDATHLIFWKRVGNQYVVRGDYVVPERSRALRQARGDSKSYTSESEEYVINADGEGPIARAKRFGKEIVIEDADADPKYRRQKLAKEFGVSDVHFVPTEAGVLEYGCASTAFNYYAYDRLAEA